MKKWEKNVLGVLSVCLLGIVVSVVVISVKIGNEITAETYGETPFNQPLASAIAGQVQAGKLRPNKAGQVVLPPLLNAAARDGIVTVNHGKHRLLLVFFPTRCERFGARGYVYCSRPLTKADMLTAAPGVNSIAIESSQHPSNDGITTHGEGQMISVPLTKQLDAHWWRIAAPDNEI